MRVAPEDSWKGITPSYYSLDFNPEPPIFAAKFAQCQNYKHILALASEDGKVRTLLYIFNIPILKIYEIMKFNTNVGMYFLN